MRLAVPDSPGRFIESRHAQRIPLAAAVRLGWINDDKRMEYAGGETVDISYAGLGVNLSRRMRLTALVHIDIPDKRVAVIGRVRNCVRWKDGWRSGIEVVAGTIPVS